MSYTQEDSCVVCHAYLFEEDDVVYCPVCGAPHHRDCYQAIGHCRLEELHGTPKQYDKLQNREKSASESAETPMPEQSETVVCRMCRKPYDRSLRQCPSCGAPNLSGTGSAFPEIDLLGGIPADYNIGEGVTAEEARQFVIANTPRYIPKFAALNPKKKLSWNWAAFLFPCSWMFSRKMIKNGIVAGLLTILATLLTFPFQQAVAQFGTTEAAAGLMQTELLRQILQLGGPLLIVTSIATLLNLSLRIFCALFGDYLYKSYAIETIQTLQKESSDIEYDTRKKGGVSLMLFAVSLLAVEYIPLILAMFIL